MVSAGTIFPATQLPQRRRARKLRAMSAGHSHVASATAFQLVARLEHYEQDMGQMLACPTDPELYGEVARHMDQMRLYAASLPEVSVAWVELLIRHFELTHCVWRMRQAGEGAAELQELRGQHQEAVQSLARKCRQLIPSA